MATVDEHSVRFRLFAARSLSGRASLTRPAQTSPVCLKVRIPLGTPISCAISIGCEIRRPIATGP